MPAPTTTVSNVSICPYYLDEFTFGFNRRRSTTRGMLFYRLLQHSVNTDPHPLHELIGGTDAPPTASATSEPRSPT